MQVVSERTCLGRKTRKVFFESCLEDAKTTYQYMVKEAYATMNNMRQDKRICDVFIINVRQHEFRCRHKNGANVCHFHIFVTDDEKSC